MTATVHTLPIADAYSVQILEQMRAAGIEELPDQITADGTLHRFGRKRASWYIVHSDPVAPVWSFGDWRLSLKEKHEGDPGRVLTADEIITRKKRLGDQRAKIAAEEERFQAGAAIEARQRWDRCQPATAEHDYLKTKRIDPCGARVDGDNLLVPMRDITGKLWSLQEIAPDGFKHNQEGGRRKGCFCQIGEIADVVCLGEGFSTCASVHMATGYAVISAGEAGNLDTVARAVREKYPDVTIIICGDDDWLTKVNGKAKNVGKIAAQKAAEAVSGLMALPWFGPARPAWAKDFNDMAKLSGADEVKTCIRLAVVAHEEELARERDGEPQPTTAAAEGAAYSDDALAVRFAELHGDGLRFVAPWARWVEWHKSHWRHDDKLRTMSLAREICRHAAEGCKE